MVAHCFSIYKTTEIRKFFDQIKDNVKVVKGLEKKLSQSDKDKAKQDAEKQIGRKLKQLDNLYKDSLETE